ncbi:hypothetical protein [Pedobacter sp.]|uniref:hypothetical protein n=1 Tax=Pedobacter sp. TaxID=1411316 RepID=UPI003BA96FC8
MTNDLEKTLLIKKLKEFKVFTENLISKLETAENHSQQEIKDSLADLEYLRENLIFDVKQQYGRVTPTSTAGGYISNA